MSKKNGLADPTRLKPFDPKDKRFLQVVIETPKGSRNKFALDSDDHIFKLKKVLPAGMAFPYDFGFVPSTKADDGDPVAECRAVDESLERLRAIGRTNRAARKILLPRIDGCGVHFPLHVLNAASAIKGAKSSSAMATSSVT